MTFGPGDANSSVSCGVRPIKPIFSPPFSITVDFWMTSDKSGSPETSALDIRIGKFVFPMNSRRISGPSSNSWLPTVMASYPNLFIISAASLPL